MVTSKSSNNVLLLVMGAAILLVFAFPLLRAVAAGLSHGQNSTTTLHKANA